MKRREEERPDVGSEIEDMEIQLNSLMDRLDEKKADVPSLRSGHHILPVSDKKIGEILVQNGALSSEDVGTVLRFQQGKTVHFAEAALALGLISRRSAEKALSTQFGYQRPDDPASTNKELVAAYNPSGRHAEVLRSLRSQLLLHWFDHKCRPLSIVSAERQEGRSYLAANLAIVFAQMAKRTLLIDADMRFPRQHTIFSLGRSFGLSSLLAGHANQSTPLQIPSFPFLFVVPAGPSPPNPQELLSQPQFKFLLEEACEHFDVVLVDTPAADAFADAELIAARAGAALVLTCKDHTRASALGKLTTRLRGNETQILGCVLNQRG